MVNLTTGDLKEAGEAEGSHGTATSQNPENISDSKILLDLVRSGMISDELYEATVNVVRDFDSVTKEKETLAKVECQSQEKILHLNRTVAALEYEKGIFESYIRRLLCPSKIKFVMENFANSSLQNIKEATRRQTNIHAELVTLANRSNEYFSNFAKQLLSISLKTQTKIDSSFHTFWDNLDTYMPCGYGDGLDPANIEKVEDNDLCRGVLELLRVENVNHALVIFNRQKCKIWEPREEILSLEDMVALEALSFADTSGSSLLLKTIGFPFDREEEEEYADDIPRIGIRVLNTTSNEYKQCLWILYTSKNSKVIEIRRKLEERWPNLERSKRMDLYATAYAKLFDVVSCQDMIGSALFLPFTNCNPTQEDFHQYIQFLATSQSSDISFVAETLCIP